MMRDYVSGLFRRFKIVEHRNMSNDLVQLLDQPQYDVEKLVPIILPASLLDMPWPGPIAALGDLPFAVAWAVMPEPNNFLYVNAEVQARWEESRTDWRAIAMKNLSHIAEDYPASWEKLDEDGKPFVQALLTTDAIGPSRLLVPRLFENCFGSDYFVTIPEKTCAIVYRATLTGDQQATVDELIGNCYEHGTEPMSHERFRPERFWVL